MNIPSGKWVKAAASANGGDCVEVFQTESGDVLVADTKQDGEDRPTLRFTASEWAAFASGMHTDEWVDSRP